jgi:hypothetical protein
MEEDERFFWEEYGDLMACKVLRALELLCGDSKACYEAYMGRSLYELAEEFAGRPDYHITEEDLELLREMPRDIYEKYDAEVREGIKVLAAWIDVAKYINEHPEKLVTVATHSFVLFSIWRALGPLAETIPAPEEEERESNRKSRHRRSRLLLHYVDRSCHERPQLLEVPLEVFHGSYPLQPLPREQL